MKEHLKSAKNLGRRISQTELTDAEWGSNTYVTDFLPLAAFLACCEHEFRLRAVGRKRKIILFIFHQTEQLRKDIDDFYRGTARVEPAAHDAERIRLRKMMDELQGGPR